MTLEDVKRMVQEHNDSIDAYINGPLAKELNAKNGMIRMEQWFKGNALIKEQGFYEKGMAILKPARAAGYDVKMDMQSNKLVLR